MVNARVSSLLLLLAVGLLVLRVECRASPQPPFWVSQLIRQADFIGLVDADPEGSDPHSEWKQAIFLYSADPLKGSLTRNFGANQYPWVHAGHAKFPGYPTWFAEKGEYLVFLQAQETGSTEYWITLAAFRVDYRPDETGKVVGRVFQDNETGRSLPVTQVRALLARALAGGSGAEAAARRLAPFLAASVLPGAASRQHKSITLEERFRQAQRLIAAIPLGTTRADIERMFPQKDGGLASSSSTRYYLGSEVMVVVPFDQTGGAWKPQNKVNGPLRLSRSLMDLD